LSVERDHGHNKSTSFADLLDRPVAVARAGGPALDDLGRFEDHPVDALPLGLLRSLRLPLVQARFTQAHAVRKRIEHPGVAETEKWLGMTAV
jgi:hypothetical protein